MGGHPRGEVRAPGLTGGGARGEECENRNGEGRGEAGESSLFVEWMQAQGRDASWEVADRMLTLADLTPEGVIKLSLGKKRHALIRPV